jgi:enoyl-CoA hydratase/isomerase-like protein
MENADVLLSRDGGLGRITLNRPKVINALTHDMARRIRAALTEWESDDAVTAVVITGAGERGLCAGGDIRAIHQDIRAGGTASLEFWRDEYALNAHIARYPKPYVAIMDGIVMGGGVGLSAHGGVRVVTERSSIGMPEVGIGLVPHVGGTYLLSRAPGEVARTSHSPPPPWDRAKPSPAGSPTTSCPPPTSPRSSTPSATSTTPSALSAAQEAVEPILDKSPTALNQVREWGRVGGCGKIGDALLDRLKPSTSALHSSPPGSCQSSPACFWLGTC